MYNQRGKRTSIQQDQAGDDGIDTQSVHERLVMKTSLISLGIEYFRAGHPIYTYKEVTGRGSSQLSSVVVLIEHSTEKQLSQLRLYYKKKERNRHPIGNENFWA